MNLIKNYENALQAIYNHVGFEEDFVVAPIDDCTDFFWETDGEDVYFANSEEELKSQKGNFFIDEVYKQRFYDKWVYEGKDFTMIFCDPRTDGMKWFRIFDNTKRISLT